jgi:hypothetical protein
VPGPVEQLALSYVSRGELPQARLAIQHGEAQLEAADVERVWRIEPLWAAQSGLALTLGDLARAHDYASRWLALATAQRARESVARAHCALARVAAIRSDFSASRAQVEAARSALGARRNGDTTLGVPGAGAPDDPDVWVPMYLYLTVPLGMFELLTPR